MSFWQIVTRLLLNFAGNPAVQASLKKAGYYVVHKATESLFNAVKNQNPRIETKRVK